MDVVGCDPFCTEKAASPDKRLKHGIQTMSVLRLRTHPEHRMRFMLLHNINVSKGWCNGTRVRLLPSFSWTGEPKTLKLETNPDTGASTFTADQVQLAEAAKHSAFNVKVVKDEDIVSKKTICYKDSHVHFVSVRTEESVCKGGRIAWKQIQGVPAYAVTVHKAQGLTMNLVYLALSKVFGFEQLNIAKFGTRQTG